MASLRQVEIWRIEALIPDVTEAMIDECLERYSLSITFLRMLVWHDAMAIQDGKLCKIESRFYSLKDLNSDESIEAMLQDAAQYGHLERLQNVDSQ